MHPNREDSDDYARLFLADTPLLDTRAPGEFLRGAFPGAVNLPLMNDEERAAVGTCYAQRGQEAAIALGHELLAGELRQQRIDAWKRFANDHPDGYLYCFRGGLRSQITQQWLRENGVEYPRITGGYKAMRRFLLDTLESRAAEADFLLVAGATGSGKTRLINAIPRSIDLEGLARHRGSAFGRLLVEQPGQIDFENALAISLLKLSQEPGPIVLEDEGRLIGRVALPETLLQRMLGAPLVVLEYGLEERVQVVLEDYIIDLGERYAASNANPALAVEAHRERLLGDLSRTRKRLGAERYKAIAASMDAAFDQQSQSGNIEAHREWIRSLLADYYDPMYRYQLAKREGDRLFSGTREAVADFLRDASSPDVA